MKKLRCLLIAAFCILISGCACGKSNEIEYVHYLRGGGSEEIEADIVWTYSNKTYTKYQVAYTSYVCSDPTVNYVNVLYIEITNAGTKEEALIRNISFSTLEEGPTTFNVGLWGDYQSAVGKDFYVGIENELLPKLKYAKYDFIKSVADKGYKNYKSIEGIDSDAIAGGTVSASNIISIVKSVFEYHLDTQY